MDRVFLTKQGKQYTVLKCKLEDIDFHYSRVYPLLDDSNVEDMYVALMVQSIEEGYAYKVEVDNAVVCFSYNVIEEKNGKGISMWGVDPIGMMLLYRVLFEDFPKHKILIDIDSNTINNFKSIAVGSSIRTSYTTSGPISVHIPPLVAKFKELYIKLGIEECLHL